MKILYIQIYTKNFMLEIIENSIKYKLGNNAIENFILIDEVLEINDNYWWFHLNDYPSGHCVIFNDVIDKKMISFASNLVKKYSKHKNNTKIKIVFTQIKNIKKTNITGQVIIKNMKFFYV